MPMPAPSKVDKIIDQLPTIGCKIIFIIAVNRTSKPICLSSFIDGTRIATNIAYNEMLKLFVTITGSKSSTKTPIIAPKIHDNHDRNEIPI